MVDVIKSLALILARSGIEFSRAPANSIIQLRLGTRALNSSPCAMKNPRRAMAHGTLKWKENRWAILAARNGRSANAAKGML